jgi:phosphohistidine phosphatase
VYLYLMRHAEAVDPGTDGAQSDSARALTEKGRRQSRRMGTALRRLGVEPDLILTSSLARAVETGRLVGEELDADAPQRALDELAPSGGAEAAWQALRRQQGTSVLVVGHLPSIARLAGWLLGCGDGEPLHFHKGSLAALHGDGNARNPAFEVEWLLAPGTVKRLAARGTHGEERS